MNTPISNNTWTPDAQAIAIKDGTIIAIGSPEAVNAFKKVSTEVVDLNGTWAIKWPWNALVLRKTVKIQRATLFTVIKMMNRLKNGLKLMANDGYSVAHHAGANTLIMNVYQGLNEADKL
jgi:hypothetical protein